MATKKVRKYPSIMCSDDPYGFEGAAREASKTDMRRFANWGGRIGDDIDEWLGQSAKRFHVGDYLSQDEINTLMDAAEILRDAKMLIRQDIDASTSIESAINTSDKPFI